MFRGGNGYKFAHNGRMNLVVRRKVGVNRVNQMTMLRIMDFWGLLHAHTHTHSQS